MTHTANDKRNALNATTKAEQKIAARIAALPQDSDEAQELINSVTNIWVIDLAEILQDEAEPDEPEELQFAADFTVTDEQVAAVNTREATTMQTTTHTPDTNELANELKLYAENTGALYAQLQAIERTTDARLDAGKPLAAKSHAIKCLKGWLDQAAHMYGREIGHHYYPRFTAAAKKQAAEMIAEEIIDEYEYRKPYR